MARSNELLTRLRWRVFAGRPNDATRITRLLRRRSGVSTIQIARHLFTSIPENSVDSFRNYVEFELGPLKRFGIVEYRSGWHLAKNKNPFAQLSASRSEADLVDAFSTLSMSYAGTCEPRLAREMAIFIADDERDEGHREHLYFCFLDVLGADWTQIPFELRFPGDLDWSKLNAFLPSESPRFDSVRTAN